MPAPPALIQNNLLSWYHKHKRDLPWRHTADPYAIWISEVMLQQTRVETVVDYWHRFLKAFPNVQTLADADEQDVLMQWQGLGYYRRARHLHQAAKEIVTTNHGLLPTTQEELKKLTGFGPYTSGSVASIAFGQKVPCVDGNVKRVLSRLYKTHKDVTPYAFDLAQHDDPSSINQGIMELGATLCKAQSPHCLICPLRYQCQALETKTIDAYPAKKIKAAPKQIYATSLILSHAKSHQLLMQQRSKTGRWAGMWEFPYFEFEHKPKNPQTMLQDQFPNATGLTFKGHVSHRLTHQHIDVDVYVADQPKKHRLKKHQTWVQDFHSLPSSILAKKIARTLTLTTD